MIRYAGVYEHVLESTTAGVTIQVSQRYDIKILKFIYICPSVASIGYFNSCGWGWVTIVLQEWYVLIIRLFILDKIILTIML